MLIILSFYGWRQIIDIDSSACVDLLRLAAVSIFLIQITLQHIIWYVPQIYIAKIFQHITIYLGNEMVKEGV